MKAMPINNYQFVFSTGPFIDSLSVTGNVYSALNLDPPENTMVLLYSQLDDSSVVKQIPDYITRAESNGEFRIDNVHPARTGSMRWLMLTTARITITGMSCLLFMVNLFRSLLKRTFFL